jgi:hypothetical protein
MIIQLILLVVKIDLSYPWVCFCILNVIWACQRPLSPSLPLSVCCSIISSHACDLKWCRIQKVLVVIGLSEMSVMRRPPRLPERSHQFLVGLDRWPLRCFCHLLWGGLQGCRSDHTSSWWGWTDDHCDAFVKHTWVSYKDQLIQITLQLNLIGA